MSQNKKIYITIGLICLDLIVAIIPVTAFIVGYYLLFKSKQEIIDLVNKHL